MSFAMILDIVMTFLLAGTIYFAWRLSDQIYRFRNSRAEMDRLVRDLNMAVDRAQGAILSLRETAQSSGDDLQKLMRQATELSDELQLMTESANSMASRLEGAAGRGRTADDVPDVAPVRQSPRAVSSVSSDDVFPGFSIRDPEFDGTVNSDELTSSNDDEWSGDDDLRSEAEKELARAMQKNKKGPRSVM